MRTAGASAASEWPPSGGAEGVQCEAALRTERQADAGLAARRHAVRQRGRPPSNVDAILRLPKRRRRIVHVLVAFVCLVGVLDPVLFRGNGIPVPRERPRRSVFGWCRPQQFSVERCHGNGHGRRRLRRLSLSLSRRSVSATATTESRVKRPATIRSIRFASHRHRRLLLDVGASNSDADLPPNPKVHNLPSLKIGKEQQQQLQLLLQLSPTN